MKTSLLRRLLRKNISAAQLIGYSIANLLGLTIVMTAIHLYTDIHTLISPDSHDTLISRDYLIISKQISLSGSLFSNDDPTRFTTDEINQLKTQPWVRQIGTFTSAEYQVAAAVDLGGRSMSTYLFFESIPEEFFDVTPPGWQFDPDDPHAQIPIIISRDYLTLYNFGFATSRGMPQISESMISMIPLRISISGAGHQQWFPARIAGFSSRINTIAVPSQFMDWANEHFADTKPQSPSRLIIETNTPGDPAIARYLREHDYQAAGDKIDNSRASYFLSTLTIIVIAIGAIISLLAFLILLLSIHLLMQKNRTTLHRLMLLGYTPHQVASPYYILTASINATILLLSIIVTLIAAPLWQTPLSAIGLTPTSPLTSIIAGTIIILLITAGNFIAIARTTRRTFPSPHNR